MRVFKKHKRAGKYTIELRDHQDVIRRFQGYADKKASGDLGRQIAIIVRDRGTREQHSIGTMQWLETMSPKLRERLIELGILERRHCGAPLKDHLDEWKKALSPGAEPSFHAMVTTKRVERLFDGCGFSTWTDVNPDAIAEHVKTLKDARPSRIDRGVIGSRTQAFYVKAARQFGRWMLRTGRAAINPLERLEAPKVGRTEARAFDLAEFHKLIAAMPKQGTAWNMSGAERSLLYRFAVTTGLRRNEINSLTVSSFDFDKGTVFVSGQHTKNGDDALLPLGVMVDELKAYCRGKMSDVHPFKVPDKSAKMLREDCTAAKIIVANERGTLNFHSLRHTCGTFLAAAGVHPNVIQKIMRHHDINLTMGRYVHTTFEQIHEGTAKMPSLTAAKKRQKRA